MKSVAAMAAIFAVFAVLPMAHAETFTDLGFTVWNGSYTSGVTNEAALPAPSLPFFPTAVFAYSGPIAFVNDTPPGSVDTFADFFGANASGISGFTSPNPNLTESDFLGLTMSTLGGTGSAINSFVEITGTYTAPSAISVSFSHADGASLYAGIGNADTVFTSPQPTTGVVTSTGVLPAGTGAPFTLIYVDTNGAPAVLSLGSPTPVTEPSSLSLLAGGVLLFGLVGLADTRVRREHRRLTLHM